MTQLEMVNSILLRLREDSVSTVNETSYSRLLAKFINDAKADVEDTNHEWSMYENEIDISILNDGTRVYAVTGSNERSYLMRNWNDEQVPAAYDVTSGEVGQLFDCPLKLLRKERALTNTIQDVTIPRTFAVKYNNSNVGWDIELLWGSTTARTFRSYWYIPQDPLATDGSDDNTVIQLPNRPIELRALSYAVIERGEELAPPAGVTWQQSTNALAAALETDLQVQKKSYEIDITNPERIRNSN